MRVRIATLCIVPCLAALGACVCSGLQAAESPAVQIAAPETGCIAHLGDVLQVLVVVDPTLDVSTVVMMCDARGIGMAQAPPYAVEWKTADFEPGDHVLRATAYLKSGEKVGAMPVTVSLFRPQALPAESAPAAAVRTAPIQPVTLKEGTAILLQTTEKMVSGRVAEGSTVRYRVARDILGPDGSLLIAYGNFAQGKVTRSRRRGMFGKAGQLEFTVETVDAIDGTVVPLRAQQEMAGKDNKTTVIATALLLTVFTVFVNGKDVEVPADTEVTAYVDHDTVIAHPTAARDREGSAARSVPAVQSASNSPAEIVRITSPAAGSELRIGTDVDVAVSVPPGQRPRLIALLCDGKRVAHHEGESTSLIWSTRGMSTGDHLLEMDVQFAGQNWMRSAPLKVTLVTE